MGLVFASDAAFAFHLKRFLAESMYGDHRVTTRSPSRMFAGSFANFLARCSSFLHQELPRSCSNVTSVERGNAALARHIRMLRGRLRLLLLPG